MKRGQKKTWWNTLARRIHYTNLRGLAISEGVLTGSMCLNFCMKFLEVAKSLNEYEVRFQASFFVHLFSIFALILMLMIPNFGSLISSNTRIVQK